MDVLRTVGMRDKISLPLTFRFYHVVPTPNTFFQLRLEVSRLSTGFPPKPDYSVLSIIYTYIQNLILLLTYIESWLKRLIGGLTIKLKTIYSPKDDWKILKVSKGEPISLPSLRQTEKIVKLKPGILSPTECIYLWDLYKQLIFLLKSFEMLMRNIIKIIGVEYLLFCLRVSLVPK